MLFYFESLLWKYCIVERLLTNKIKIFIIWDNYQGHTVILLLLLSQSDNLSTSS